MVDVQQAYIKIKESTGKLKLTSILDFGESFGFLFGDPKGNILFGNSYILINKQTGDSTLLPTIPINIKKINSAKDIPLTSIL